MKLIQIEILYFIRALDPTLSGLLSRLGSTEKALTLQQREIGNLYNNKQTTKKVYKLLLQTLKSVKFTFLVAICNQLYLYVDRYILPFFCI